MKSSSIKKLRKLLENEVEQAESIIAARGFSQELQSMIEKLGRLINEDLPAVAEQMRMSLGADTATAFENQTVEVIQGVMDQLRNGKQDIDNSVAAIGEGRPIDSTPAFDDESDLDDELPSEDLLDLDADGEEDLDLGGEEELELGGEEELDLGDEEELPLGRAKKESIEYSEELSEKWKGDAEVESTGEYADKTIAELKAMLSKLKKSGPHEEGSDEFEKQNQIEFAIRAKRGWKGGVNEGAVDKNYEDMARYARAYRKARVDGERSFTVNGKTYKLVGDKEELEEMDRKCEAFFAKHHKLEESPESNDSVEEFYDYFMSFYGDGGLYDFGATKEEIDQALEIRKNTPIYKDVPFEGDTVDREIIRDIILDEIRGEK